MKVREWSTCDECRITVRVVIVFNDTGEDKEVCAECLAAALVELDVVFQRVNRKG